MALEIRKASFDYLIEKAKAFDPEIYKRIISSVDVGSAWDCWPWKKNLHPDNPYPQIRIKGPKRRVSRLIFRMFFRDLQEKECVLHSCDNPPCCNPRHLHAGSHHQNMLERKARNRSGDRNGIKNGRAVLTEAQALYVLKSDKSLSVLAEKYGVTKTAISSIRRGKNWKYLSSRGVK